MFYRQQPQLPRKSTHLLSSFSPGSAAALFAGTFGFPLVIIIADDDRGLELVYWPTVPKPVALGAGLREIVATDDESAVLDALIDTEVDTDVVAPTALAEDDDDEDEGATEELDGCDDVGAACDEGDCATGGAGEVSPFALSLR